MRSKRLILADLRELLHPIYTDLAADSLLGSCKRQVLCAYFVRFLVTSVLIDLLERRDCLHGNSEWVAFRCQYSGTLTLSNSRVAVTGLRRIH